jgi:hypothetical protein
VDGQPPGSVIHKNSPAGSVWVRAKVESMTPFGTLELLANGESVVRVSSSDAEPPFRAMAEVECPVDSPCWFAARCAGSDAFAHSSPIFVRVDGKMPASAAVVQRYLSLLDGTLEWIESTGRFDKPRRKEQLVAVIEQARQMLLERTPIG